MAFKEDSSYHLLTLEELAEYVGRHPQIIRRYYAEGTLPEPAHMQKHKKKTTRRFTLSEAEHIKGLFDNAKWGFFARRKENAKNAGR